MLIKNNNKNKKGFTIVEMLVSLSIVSVIMTVVLFNYSTFTDNLALTSAGQEVAVTIRQAQTYGLTVKEVSPTGGVFDRAFGAYFNKTDPSNYYLFADSFSVSGNKKYDAGTGCGTGSSNTECVEKSVLRNGVTVYDVCSTTCSPLGSNAMHITFLRPNPDARIYLTGGSSDVGPSLIGKVILTSPKGKKLDITIEGTGQVLVGQPY